MKPHIGLNADYKAGEKAFHKLYVDYTKAVEAAGGVPVVISALSDDEDILSILATLDGLVLTGGDDIDPQVYGQAAHPSTSPISPERQHSDLRLIELAMVMEVPILGICMGCQLINVALGGTLLQDIPSQAPSQVPHGPSVYNAKTMHRVNVVDGTRLRTIVKAETILTDSSHHQAVAELGRGLVVSARAEDETIEAIELPGPWVLGVQWHPERTAGTPEHLALFEALVAVGAAKT